MIMMEQLITLPILIRQTQLLGRKSQETDLTPLYGSLISSIPQDVK